MPDTEIETIQNDIGEDGKRDQAGPDEREVKFHQIISFRWYGSVDIDHGYRRYAGCARRANLVNTDTVIRPLRHQAQQVECAGAKNCEVNHDKGEQGGWQPPAPRVGPRCPRWTGGHRPSRAGDRPQW